MGGSLPASAAWLALGWAGSPAAHAALCMLRPTCPQARQVDAFVELLLRELWSRLTPQERRENRQLQVPGPTPRISALWATGLTSAFMRLRLRGCQAAA
jgi:hypothetical protein